MKRILAILCSCSLSFCLATEEGDSQMNTVLSYWFGDLKGPDEYFKDKMGIWFGGGEDVDLEIKSLFEPLLLDAIDSKLDSWKNTPEGRLAFIILLDQFSRNIYRGSPKAFSFDSLAQKITLEGLEKGDDLKLFPIQRTFFYLPLEHSEEMDLQKLSLDKFNELALNVPPLLTADFKGFADYALQHYVIIERFGRFPHRNEILGRDSTFEEMEFLKGPNSSF